MLIGLGSQGSLVVHGADGMDEITTTGETQVVEQRAGVVREYVLTPEQFGMARVPVGQLALADKAESIRMAQAVLRAEAPRPHEDLVVLNAGAGLYLGGKVAGIAAGIELARQTLRSGAARKLTERVAAYTQAKVLKPEPAA